MSNDQSQTNPSAGHADPCIRMRCPHCRNPIEVVTEVEYDEVDCPSCGSSFNLIGDETTVYQTQSTNVAHFELKQTVGRGAFGTVWKAYDPELDRHVAIKFPRGNQVDKEYAGSIVREARAAARLNHPNIVSVHEIGREEGEIYIVSDFVDGVTMESWLTAGRPEVREAMELLLKVASAVQHAHENGVVHRDLKPSNIMLDEHGEPRVMDFGLAKRDAAEITVTLDGAQLGTPAYMPPEQIVKANEADARSDVYSLGVIMFKMLTGELPFRGDRAMLLYQVRNEEPASPKKLVAKLPKDLETICLKCLRKSPERRFQSAKELADDISRFLNDQPIKASPPTQLELFWRWYCKYAVTLLGAFWATSGILALGIFFIGRWLDPTAFLSSYTHAAVIISQLFLSYQFCSSKHVKLWLWITVPYVPFFYLMAVLPSIGDGLWIGIGYHTSWIIGTILVIGALITRYSTRTRMNI